MDFRLRIFGAFRNKKFIFFKILIAANSTSKIYDKVE